MTNTPHAKSFAAYMNRVDAYLLNRADVTHLDLPDYDYAACYEGGISPAEAARGALTEAGGF